MIGRLVSGIVAASVFAGAYWIALDLANSTRLAVSNRGKESDGGPQIVLRGVEMVEARRGGTVWRLVSEDASYSVLAERVTASAVRLALAERDGDIEVTAPVAIWNMNEGGIDLAQGAIARSPGGWIASAPGAHVNLKSEEITAEEVLLTGPGVTISGRHLRWRWRDGAVGLDFPRGTVLPGRIRAPKGKG